MSASAKGGVKWIGKNPKVSRYPRHQNQPVRGNALTGRATLQYAAREALRLHGVTMEQGPRVGAIRATRSGERNDGTTAH